MNLLTHKLIAKLVGIVCSTALLANCCPEPVSVSAPTTSNLSQTFIIDNPEIDEASGLARSHYDANIIWLHNDSGDAARVYAVDQTGHYRGSVSIQHTDANDWEDMASFIWQGQPYLLLADIGDNRSVRDYVDLYVIAEPKIAKLADGFALSTPVVWHLCVIYPDGARDAEGVAVDAEAGLIYLLSKRDQPPRLYQVPLQANSRLVMAEFVSKINYIAPVSQAELIANPVYGQYRNQPTAMDLSPNQQQLLIVTYSHSYLYTKIQNDTWTATLKKPPLVMTNPNMPQLEASGFHHDGVSLWFASERLPAMLSHVPLMTKPDQSDN